MRVYLAARFEHRTTLRPIRDRLWEMGHEVVSSWLEEVKKPDPMPGDIFRKKLAVKDLTEIRAAEMFVLDTHVGSERGGKEVEFGFALGQFQGKLVVIVGPPRNVFHALADYQFNTWEEYLNWMPSHSS